MLAGGSRTRLVVVGGDAAAEGAAPCTEVQRLVELAAAAALPSG
jgi:hypothetical protein